MEWWWWRVRIYSPVSGNGNRRNSSQTCSLLLLLLSGILRSWCCPEFHSRWNASAARRRRLRMVVRRQTESWTVRKVSISPSLRRTSPDGRMKRRTMKRRTAERLSAQQEKLQPRSRPRPQEKTDCPLGRMDSDPHHCCWCSLSGD